MKNKNLKVTCPDCGAKGEKTTSSRLCASNIDTETKNALLEGKFFEWNCPKCAKSYFINTSFLYNDDARKFMIYLVPGFKDKDFQVPTVIKTNKDYDTDASTLRIAPTFSAFVEKIRIFEAGLDDKIVEIIKLLYINMHMQDGGEKVYDMIFESVSEAGDLFFGVFLENDDYEQIIPKGVYDNTVLEFSSQLPEETRDFVVINQGWLNGILGS
jgi:endogenous inhibitor of DNA gyrase (YacG/DUF329 family)